MLRTAGGRGEEEELLCCSAQRGDEDSSAFFQLVEVVLTREGRWRRGEKLSPPPIKAKLRFLISLSKPGHENRAGQTLSQAERLLGNRWRPYRAPVAICLKSHTRLLWLDYNIYPAVNMCLCPGGATTDAEPAGA